MYLYVCICVTCVYYTIIYTHPSDLKTGHKNSKTEESKCTKPETHNSTYQNQNLRPGGNPIVLKQSIIRKPSCCYAKNKIQKRQAQNS